jgi:hypothetical protein
MMPPPPPPVAGLPPIGKPHGGPGKNGGGGGGGGGRKTLRLHWQEAKAEFFTPSGRTSDTVWSKAARELGVVKVDTALLAELFETKTTELKLKVGHRLTLTQPNG